MVNIIYPDDTPLRILNKDSCRFEVYSIIDLKFRAASMFDRPIYQRQQYCIRFYYCGCYLCLMLLLMLCKFKNLKIAVEFYVWRAFSGLKIEQSL